MTRKESFLKRVEKTNEMFNNATNAEKRVMVAKDCIERIKLKMVTPATSRILSIPYGEVDINRDTINSVECEVCAKGGLLTSFVGRVNNFNVDYFKIAGNSAKTPVHQKLSEIFTYKQLSLIELAFEGSQYLDFDNKNRRINFSNDTFKRAIRFLTNFDATERLIKICENIIKNKGTFKP